MITFSTSSWTLHGRLGQARYEHTLDGRSWLKSGSKNPDMSLLELPAFVAKDDIPKVELCHFHFPSVESDYLAKLKEAIEKAELTLENLLLDTGNIATPDPSQLEQEIAIAKMWIDIAAEVGAKGCRIACGTEPPREHTKEQVIEVLQELNDYASSKGVVITTENFKETGLQADDLLEIISRTNRPLKLCIDFGNAAKSGDKYGTLQKLMPQGTSLHCKGEYQDNQLDRQELLHSLSLVNSAGFSGFVSLVYDGTENEWEKTLELRDEITAFFRD